MAHFEIKNLSFIYPTTGAESLTDVNLKIEKGEYITICGKSGSGKTTLLRQLKTALTPYGIRSGEVLFNEVPLDSIPEKIQSAQIGYVMQNPDSQLVTDKVWHELAFGLESIGTDAKTMRLRVAEMANYFGIENWFHKNVSELSGGQKQLLNLASIMAMQPSALILDEPTAQLDPIAAADFLNTVRKINLELGTTVILSEHRLEEVFPSADRVAVMESGKISALDSPHKIGELLYERKSDMFAALPSPMKIFYGINSRLNCPLTVREGRNWLSEEVTEIVAESLDKSWEEELEENETVVELNDIWFRYEKNSKDVLKGASFSVKKGAFFAIVGGNGAGKSTMLKAMCGICSPYRGKITINQKPIKKYLQNDLFNGCLAMLPQDPQSLFVKNTVRDDLLEMPDKRLSAQEKEAMVSSAAADCEITALLDSHPYDLSGGEQQRAALAKVLLCNPKILLLDEPTKGIDDFYKIKLADILKRLRKRGVTVIMVSHDVEFCAKYATEVSMFFDGGIVTTNKPSLFFSQNSFYTTAANRMSRHLFKNAVTNEDVIELCLLNGRLERERNETN